MEDRIREHIDGIFSDTPPTRKAVELKEEMIQNLQDKYSDLIAEGKTPDAAYNIVVAGIGDVSGLLRELDSDDMPDSTEREEVRRKSAMLNAIAVALLVLGVVPVIVLGGRQGIVGMFVMGAVAVGLLVFDSMMRPKASHEPDSMVEEFREWQSGNHVRRSMMRAISSAVWSVTVALYFIISFSTGAWHISWVIFLIAGAAQSLIAAFFPFGESYHRAPFKAISSAMWLMVVVLYILISFQTGAWHISWVIFLVAAAAQSLLKAFLIVKR